MASRPASSMLKCPPRMTMRPAASPLVPIVVPCESEIVPSPVKPVNIGSASVPAPLLINASPGDPTATRLICPPGAERRAGWIAPSVNVPLAIWTFPPTSERVLPSARVS